MHTQIDKHAIRWMIAKDLPRCAVFDRLWGEREIKDALRDKCTIAMIVERGELPRGYMIYKLYSTSIFLYQLAVDPDWRRQGLGSRLLGRLKEKINPTSRRKFIQTNLPETELEAHLFLKANGFRAFGVIDDSYWFCYPENLT